MTRALQDRLALASVKIQNGWEDMSLDAIEAQVDERLQRKRPASSNDTISDTASTTSSRLHSSSGGLASSPLSAPIFSDEFQRSGSSHSNKKIRPSDVQKFPSLGPITGRRQRVSSARHRSWKSGQGLPESSPIHHTKHARFASHNLTQLSFISEGSTIPDEPQSPEFSEDDDADLPVTSFTLSSSTRITSSPPHTPPPDRRMRKAHNVAWSRTPKDGEEGADLLIYLATSPSPAKGQQTIKPVILAPSTPPAKSTPLPSSHMTPGTSGAGFLGFGPNTPGANFNFADFVNVTPSPAQAPWRTPGAARTPAATKEARRKLNFDNLMPPTSSPVLTRSTRSDGLGMELGGELVSSQ